MSYREVRQILNAVFDSDDNVLKTIYKTDGEVLNMVLDETGDPALKVRIEGYEGASAQTAGIGANLLINSAGLINQRGYVSGTATASANQYTLDRWKVAVSGQSLVFSKTENIVTFTAPAGGCEQVVEGLSIMTGVYTLSWEGTASASVNGGSVANSGQVTLTGGTNATVRFTGGTFKKPKLEYGGTATEWTLPEYSSELSACKRFLPLRTLTGVPYHPVGFGYPFSTTQANITLNTTSRGRITPTQVIYSGTWRLQRSGSSIPVTALSIAPAACSTDNITVIATVASGLSEGLYTLLSNNDTTAYIEIPAEI